MEQNRSITQVRLTCTCHDPVDSAHQLLFGLEGQQLVRGDEGRGSKLGAGLIQRLGHDRLFGNRGERERERQPRGSEPKTGPLC